jgi:hypothetical protein
MFAKLTGYAATPTEGVFVAPPRLRFRAFGHGTLSSNLVNKLRVTKLTTAVLPNCTEIAPRHAWN